MPDDPYTRLQALAAHGRTAAARAALEPRGPVPTMLPVIPRPPDPPLPPRVVVAWERARVHGAMCEDRRAFAAALAIYDSVDRDDANRVELGLARARCCLRLGIHSMAYAHACDVLAVAPDHPVAVALRRDIIARHLAPQRVTDRAIACKSARRVE